jgi:hypothetical protein
LSTRLSDEALFIREKVAFVLCDANLYFQVLEMPRFEAREKSF